MKSNDLSEFPNWVKAKSTPGEPIIGQKLDIFMKGKNIASLLREILLKTYLAISDLVSKSKLFIEVLTSKHPIYCKKNKNVKKL